MIHTQLADVETYLNSVLASKSEKFTTEYEELDITPEAAETID